MNSGQAFEFLVKHFHHKMPLGSVSFELEVNFSIARHIYSPPSFAEMISGVTQEPKYDLYSLSAAEKHRIFRFTKEGVIPSWPIGIDVDEVIPYEQLKRIIPN